MPLLLGESPSKKGDEYWQFPLSGNPAKVLCQLAGLKYEGGAWYWTLVEHFETRNLIERFADAYPKRVEEDRRRARQIELRPVTVALGRRAGDAMDLRDRPWGEWHIVWQTMNGTLVQGVTGRAPIGALRSGYVAVLPHPSGLNRLLNEEEVREMMGRVLREAIEKARELA